MEAPHVGDRVKYVGCRLEIPEGFIEDPKRLGRLGTVVNGRNADGGEVPSPPGQWPVHVEWDNGDATQTCFKDEVVKLEEGDLDGEQEAQNDDLEFETP